MKTHKNISEKIGNTPLFVVNAAQKAVLYVKAESFNPAGSVKDRAAFFMLRDAEEKGLVGKNTLIIEPTSGNTGIALAALCAEKGYRIILTMPETMSVERRRLLSAYGAELVLTEGAKGMKGAIEKAQELAAKNPDSFIPGQFENPANALAHYQTTGPEIWKDTSGKIDALVTCVGTGGTITGTGRYLKEKNPDIKVFAVEPASSPVLSGGKSGKHGIQGIGAGFVPSVLDRSVIDEVLTVTDEDAFSGANELAKHCGLLLGISSGAAYAAAKKVAARPEFAGKNIVFIAPDTGERYTSTGVYAASQAKQQ